MPHNTSESKGPIVDAQNKKNKKNFPECFGIVFVGGTGLVRERS